MVNGPPCQVCGYPLRWFGEQNAWGCDRCQRMFPAAPPQQQMQARPKSKLGLWLAVGGVAVAGGVIAIVLAMKGGGGGGGASSAKALAEQTIAAMGAGDVDALVKLTGAEKMFSTAIKCDDTADPEDRDVQKQLEKSKRQFTRGVEKVKGLKLELADFPDVDKRDPSSDLVMKKGDKMGKGCVANIDVHIVDVKLGLKVDGKDQKSKMMMINVDGKWYLADLPEVAKGGGFDAQLVKLGAFRDQICACKDQACAEGVQKDMQAWSEAAMKDMDSKPTPEDMEKAEKITKELTECMMKASGLGTPPVNAAEPPAAQIANDSGTGDLPKECNDWGEAIAKLATCSKYPKSASEAMKKSFDEAVVMWKKMPADSRASLAPSCANAAKTIRDSAKQVGCP